MAERVAIIRDPHMHLYQTGKEKVCLNCCYPDCVEWTDDRGKGCPLRIGSKYGLSPDEMLPLVQVGRYHLERWGHAYNPDNISRMAQIAAERKQLDVLRGIHLAPDAGRPGQLGNDTYYEQE